MKTRFKNIDSTIKNTATELAAMLTIDRPDYPWKIEELEERRIDWTENDINKAIIIQPTFTYDGINNNQWNFNLVAWNTNKESNQKSSYSHSLVYRSEFISIENNIKSLLEKGIEILSNLNLNDLVLNIRIKLFLDLDGVLITTPNWKSDEIDSDGYSKFNEKCISNLNLLLEDKRLDIWISSTRRIAKSINEMRKIFRNRSIKGYIKGYLPNYEDCRSRKDEILRFITENDVSYYIILDDDKSLNGLIANQKNQLVLTEPLKGFNQEKLMEAKKIINEMQKKNYS